MKLVKLDHSIIVVEAESKLWLREANTVGKEGKNSETQRSGGVALLTRKTIRLTIIYNMPD